MFKAIQRYGKTVKRWKTIIQYDTCSIFISSETLYAYLNSVGSTKEHKVANLNNMKQWFAKLRQQKSLVRMVPYWTVRVEIHEQTVDKTCLCVVQKEMEEMFY